MDDLLPKLLSFPPHPPPPQKLSDNDYDRNIRDLIEQLNKVSASKLTAGVKGGGDLLDILDPSINTLPYLYTLLAHIDGSSTKQSPNVTLKMFPPTGSLWRKMLDFMDTFDPVQVRYVGFEWRRLIDAVVRVAEASSNANVAIPPVRTAILRLDPTSSCFTSTHLYLIHLCLYARKFTEALPVLDKDIYHFPSIADKNSHLPLPCGYHDTSSTYITAASSLSSKLSYIDHLKYFLYGAMIYMALKRWDRALQFLEIVIMSPAHNTASMIQVEAYKKRVLVGLLHKGRPLSMPRTTNTQAAKHFRALARAYDNLAQVFQEGNGEKLYAEFHAAQQLWQSDFNMSLVLQVLSAFRRFLILKLGRTYAALPLPDVARATSPAPINIAETEQYVAQLIASGQLNATLVPAPDSSKPSILRFAASSAEGPLARSEAQQYQDLVAQTNKMVSLAAHMKGMDRRIELSREYLEWTRKTRRVRVNDEAGGMGGSALAMGDYADGWGVDEDVLAEM